MNKRIILASASPRRREILSQVGLSFEVKVSQAEEKTGSRIPSEMVMELSDLKAEDIFASLSEEEKKETLVIGADTVVAKDGIVMGKPKTVEQAEEMLSALQGTVHHVYTGVTLIWENTKVASNGASMEEVCKKSFYEETAVEIYPMTKEEIRNYIKTGEPMDKAGAYGIQGIFAAHIKGITGDYYNVVGLPIGRLCQEIKNI